MAEYTYVDVIPSLIENTNMQKMLRDGVDRTYYIEPCDGYVLHDSGYDDIIIDPETNEETVLLGYRTYRASVPVSYDFTANPRQFYAVPENEVPADRIFGSVTQPKPEIM